MEDGIKTIGLGGTSAALGRAVGTGLGSGIEALAKMKLQSMQKEKSAQALSHFVGGNINAARRMMDLTEKERFAVLQNLSGQGGQDGLAALAGQGVNTGQANNTGQGQGVNFFAKQPTPISLYQQKQLEIDERKAVAAEEKNKNLLSAQQVKASNDFYEKYIHPDIQMSRNLSQVNKRLESLKESSKGITVKDRGLELIKNSAIPFATGIATFMQSPSAALAGKQRAAFLQDYSKTLGGSRSTEFLVEAYMKQYPDALLQGELTVEKIANDIIGFNNFLINEAKLKQNIFNKNPNISPSQLDNEIESFYNKLLTDQKPEESQQVEDESSNIRPSVGSFMSEEPNQTQTPNQINTPEERNVFQKGYDLMADQTKAALQIVLPNTTIFGNQINKLIRNMPKGKTKNILQVISRFAGPTDAEANKFLEDGLGLTKEQIKNPGALIETLRDYAPYAFAGSGVAKGLLKQGLKGGAKELALLLGTIGSSVAGKEALGEVGGKIGKSLGNEALGKDIGEVAGNVVGGALGYKLTGKGIDFFEKRSAKKDFIEKRTKIETDSGSGPDDGSGSGSDAGSGSGSGSDAGSGSGSDAGSGSGSGPDWRNLPSATNQDRKNIASSRSKVESDAMLKNKPISKKIKSIEKKIHDINLSSSSNKDKLIRLNAENAKLKSANKIKLNKEKLVIDKNQLKFRVEEEAKGKAFGVEYEQANQVLNKNQKIEEKAAKALREKLEDIWDDASASGQSNKQVSKIINNAPFSTIEQLIESKKILGNLQDKAPYTQKSFIINTKDALQDVINEHANSEYLKEIAPINKRYRDFKKSYKTKNLGLSKRLDEIKKKELEINNALENGSEYFEAKQELNLSENKYKTEKLKAERKKDLLSDKSEALKGTLETNLKGLSEKEALLDVSDSKFKATLKALEEDKNFLSDVIISGAVAAFTGSGAKGAAVSKFIMSYVRSGGKLNAQLQLFKYRNPLVFEIFEKSLIKQKNDPSTKNFNALKESLKAIFLLN
jgi:hypothetical protein